MIDMAVVFEQASPEKKPVVGLMGGMQVTLTALVVLPFQLLSYHS